MFRYLAHGAKLQVLAWLFRIGVSTARKIVYETCDFIWEELSGIYLSVPNEHEWKKIAEDFFIISNMPNCVGALDGKHIAIERPPGSGLKYYSFFIA